jgi:hypothetical protein
MQTKGAKYSVRRYNDARNSTREAINGLRLLLIRDSDPNQILNIQSLGANNIELQNKEIKRFRAEGKTRVC